jgi:protein involved in ribonucleotide reduction
MSYDNLSSVSQNVLKFYQQLTGDERRIPFIFDDFHFSRSRVIELDNDGKYDFYPMSYDNLSSVSQNVLKFYQQLTGEERRIPFIFDDFHFSRSRVIGLDNDGK